MEDSEAIKLTGVDERLTSPVDPGKPSMYDIHFFLSRSPDPEWIATFNGKWHSHLYQKKRGARVSGRHMVVYAPLEEAQEHQKQLASVMEDVNIWHAQHSEARVSEARMAAARSTEEQKRKKDLLGKLKFD